jgi:glycosyltransferase involved in cell wall biosynthesis
MDVSVVVPIHNARQHIPTLLDAFDRLRGRAIEFVVIDDHSTDDGPALVEAWTPRHGCRKLQLRSTGSGVAAARNQAVAAASGDYVWFADADDTWQDDVLERLLTSARPADHDLAICNALRVDESTGARELVADAPITRVTSGPQATRALLRGQVQGHLWNKLVRRELFTGIQFPPTRAHSDLGGLLQLCARARTVVFTPEVLYEYRVHAGSVMHSPSYRWMDLPDVLEIAERVVMTMPDNVLGKQDLSLFAARYVWLPLAHEGIRRCSTAGDDQAAAAWAEARHRLQWNQLTALVGDRHHVLAMRGAVMKASPRLYAALYAAYRHRCRAGLDTHLISPPLPLRRGPAGGRLVK